MADLSVLRTAKLAVDEGLLEVSDFAVVKAAFVKAQQIKAGIDAGFLREEDYARARDAFLHALDFNIASSSSAAAPALPQPPPQSQRFAAPAAARAPPAGPRAPPLAPAPNSTPAPSPATAPGARPRASSTGGAAPHIQDLPPLGKHGLVTGKKSMSGISVSEQCITVFNHIKTNSTFKWVLFKIDDHGNEVVIEEVGPLHSSYAAFVAALPEMQCRYGVFDYEYTNADTGKTLNKLVFVNWAPDVANIRTKMMYASTKDFFKGFLDGVGAELQATEMHELSESEMKEQVQRSMTRK